MKYLPSPEADFSHRLSALHKNHNRRYLAIHHPFFHNVHPLPFSHEAVTVIAAGAEDVILLAGFVHCSETRQSSSNSRIIALSIIPNSNKSRADW
jgi:hypothetical protein